MRDFEKDLNDLNAIGVKNPSLAKGCLVDYLFSQKEFLQESMSLFMDSLEFSEQCTISTDKQAQLIDFWRDKATKLKEKLDNLEFKTRNNLDKHLHNLIYLKNLNLNSEILFV